MTATRPTINSLPSNIGYAATFTMTATIPAGATKVVVVLMDLGFATHTGMSPVLPWLSIC